MSCLLSFYRWNLYLCYIYIYVYIYIYIYIYLPEKRRSDLMCRVASGLSALLWCRCRCRCRCRCDAGYAMLCYAMLSSFHCVKNYHLPSSYSTVSQAKQKQAKGSTQFSSVQFSSCDAVPCVVERAKAKEKGSSMICLKVVRHLQYDLRYDDGCCVACVVKMIILDSTISIW
jgi:hypothetical protein